MAAASATTTWSDGISISRPVLSEERLSLTPGGLVRYQLKTP